MDNALLRPSEFERKRVPNSSDATAYDARGTVTGAEFDEVMARYLAESAAATNHLTGHTGLVFDEASGQALDIWGVGSTPRPVFFVVHGGYWRALSRQHTEFMARVLADHEVATVAIDYGLAPATAMTEIVRQVRAAYAFIVSHGAEYGLIPERIVVGGSSAGAHLAAMTMVDEGWTTAHGIPGRAARSALLISGLYDLRPLISTPANDWLQLTEPIAAELSPALGPPPSDANVVIAAAKHEAAGFTAQSRALHRQWSRSSNTRELTIPGRHHFDVFLELANPDSTLTDALLTLFSTATESDGP